MALSGQIQQQTISYLLKIIGLDISCKIVEGENLQEMPKPTFLEK